MRNDRAFDGPPRIDVKAAGRAEKAVVRDDQHVCRRFQARISDNPNLGGAGERECSNNRAFRRSERRAGEVHSSWSADPWRPAVESWGFGLQFAAVKIDSS